MCRLCAPESAQMANQLLGANPQVHVSLPDLYTRSGFSSRGRKMKRIMECFVVGYKSRVPVSGTELIRILLFRGIPVVSLCMKLLSSPDSVQSPGATLQGPGYFFVLPQLRSVAPRETLNSAVDLVISSAF